MAKLYAPKSYWNATNKEKQLICNGCGAKGGIKVPNTMYGLNIKEACNIHDFMYYDGTTIEDFHFSNAMFLYNLSAIIMRGNKFLIPFRLARATKYFLAVELEGLDAFGRVDYLTKRITFQGEFRDEEV